MTILEDKIKHSNSILNNNEYVYGIIYKITNKINNKIYIGQTLSHRLNHKKYRPFGIYKRFNDHISSCKHKLTDSCKAINNALREYDIKNFVIEELQKCNIDELDKYEKYYIDQLNTIYPNGYNLTKGGKSFTVMDIENLYTEKYNNVLSKKKEHIHKKIELINIYKPDITVDNYLEKIIPIRDYNTKEIKFYRIPLSIVNGRMKSLIFKSKKENIEILYNRAKKFLEEYLNINT